MTTILNCEHEKQEMVMNRKIHERPYVRRPRQKLKLQRNPRAVRACPSSALSPPMQRDETTHPSTIPQLSYPGSFLPRKSVGAHSDSLGERRCGSYGTTRSSRRLSQAVTRPRLSSQGIPRPNPGPSRSPWRRVVSKRPPPPGCCPPG